MMYRFIKLCKTGISASMMLTATSVLAQPDELPFSHYKGFQEDPLVTLPIEFVPSMLELGYQSNQTDDKGLTPLMKAVALNDLARAKLLFKFGGDPLRQTPGGFNLMDLALRCNQSELESLCRSMPRPKGQYPFLDEDARTDTVEWLLTLKLPHPTPAQLLGVPLSTDSAIFNWAMERIDQMSNEEIAALLDHFWMTPTDSFGIRNYESVMNEANSRGITKAWSPLTLLRSLEVNWESISSGQNYWDLLLSLEEDINRPLSQNGDTLIMALAQAKSLPEGFLQIALAHGADPNQTNNDGLSARDIAKRRQAQGEDVSALTPLL